VADLLLFAVAGRAVAARALGQRGEPVVAPIVALLAFVVWCWLTLWVNDAPTTTALARVTLYVIAFIACADDATGARRLLQGVALFAAIEGLLGVAHLTPYERGRLVGTYGDPAQTGLLLIAGLCLSSLLPRPLALIGQMSSAAGIIATLTRSVWVGAVAALSVHFLPNARKGVVRIALVVGVVLGVGWLAAPTVTARYGLSTESITLRTESWRNGLAMIEERPLVGYGWALGRDELTVAQLQDEPNPFSLWVNIGASTGLIGLVLLAVFFVVLMRSLVLAKRPETNAVMCYVVGFLAVSAGEMVISAANPATITFVAVAGAGLALAGTDRNSFNREELLHGRSSRVVGSD
jgi:O-antigen ligase